MISTYTFFVVYHGRGDEDGLQHFTDGVLERMIKEPNALITVKANSMPTAQDMAYEQAREHGTPMLVWQWEGNQRGCEKYGDLTMSNIDELKGLAKDLLELLEKPSPGTLTWREMLNDVLAKISNFHA